MVARGLSEAKPLWRPEGGGEGWRVGSRKSHLRNAYQRRSLAGGQRGERGMEGRREGWREGAREGGGEGGREGGRVRGGGGGRGRMPPRNPLEWRKPT